MRVLVTGHRGFIGSWLLERIGDVDLLGIDRADGNDICDARLASTITRFDPELVFHLAAEHMVPWCREHPQETWETNVVGTQRLLAALEVCHPRAIVLASSAAVYGYGSRPFSETSTATPVDVYGRSKAAAEAHLAKYSMDHPDVVCVAARLANVVGSRDANDHLWPKLARAARGERIRVGNLTPLRDYIHASDVANALVALSWARAGYSVYNVATGVGTSVQELIEAFGLEVEQEAGRDNDGDLVLDPGLIEWDLAWQHRLSVADSIAEMTA